VGTPSSLHFYSQEAVDVAVRSSLGLQNKPAGQADVTVGDDVVDDVGVRVWVDAQEWSVCGPGNSV
jgi:hypothetical protein